MEIVAAKGLARITCGRRSRRNLKAGDSDLKLYCI
jgi:hypothetical protein